MKKLISILATILLAFEFSTAQAEPPTIVLMKFTNDTRYQKVDVPDVLSDLVIEKLLSSGKFNLVESKPIDRSLQQDLYDEKSREIQNAQAEIANGNFNSLFEGSSFNPKLADSISTAQVGQIVSPEITSKIGQDNGAKYLIQGTIVGMGNDTWRDENAEIGNTIGSIIAAALTKDKSLLKGGADNVVQKAMIVECELRIIEASTGKVVYFRSSTCTAGKEIKGKGVTTKDAPDLQSKEFMNLLNFVSDKLSKGLIKDLDEGKIF